MFIWSNRLLPASYLLKATRILKVWAEKSQRFMFVQIILGEVISDTLIHDTPFLLAWSSHPAPGLVWVTW